MSSKSESIGEPMESQPDYTTTIVGDNLACTSSATNPQPVTMVTPVITPDELNATIANLYNLSTNESDGFRRKDLSYIYMSARSARQRETLQQGLYFSHVPERQRIIQKFFMRVTRESINNDSLSINQFEKLRSALCWAFLQVSDLEVLRKLEETFSNPALPEVFENIEQAFTAWSLQFRIFRTKVLDPEDMEAWKHILDTSGEKLADPNNFASRKSVRQDCRMRDGSRCIITKEPDPDVCHIYPMSGINNPYRDTLKTAVATIWGTKRAEEIHHRLFEQGIDGTDWLGNLVCLCPNMHRAWENGRFVLYPHRAQQNVKTRKWEMRLTFYWLKKVYTEMNFQLGATDFLRSAAERFGTHDGEGGLVQAFNMFKATPILDGEIITIQANAEEALPDYDIMMLQYDVLRMASLCGGAEPVELEESDSDDDAHEAVELEAAVEVAEVDNTDTEKIHDQHAKDI